MHSDKIKKVKVVIGDEVWEVVWCYSQQVGRLTAKKDQNHIFQMVRFNHTKIDLFQVNWLVQT